MKNFLLLLLLTAANSQYAGWQVIYVPESDAYIATKKIEKSVLGVHVSSNNCYAGTITDDHGYSVTLNHDTGFAFFIKFARKHLEQSKKWANEELLKNIRVQKELGNFVLRAKISANKELL